MQSADLRILSGLSACMKACGQHNIQASAEASPVNPVPPVVPVPPAYTTNRAHHEADQRICKVCQKCRDVSYAACDLWHVDDRPIMWCRAVCLPVEPVLPVLPVPPAKFQRAQLRPYNGRYLCTTMVYKESARPLSLRHTVFGAATIA